MIFISNTGECLPIVYRLYLEGVDVVVYIHDPTTRQKCYRGILPSLGIPGLMKELKHHDTVIFDLTHPNAKSEWDFKLLRAFQLKTSELYVFGPIANILMKTHRVIGCSRWSEEIEMDRLLGTQIAKEIGLTIPTSHEFKSLDDGIRFLESDEAKKSRWVLKPMNNEDLDLTYVESYGGELLEKMKNEMPKRTYNPSKFWHMMQEVIDGTEISSEAWYRDGKFMSYNRTIEGKKFLCGNLGSQIGSQSNTVFYSQSNKIIFKEMQKLIPHLKKAGYEGPVDANCIIDKQGKPNFLEWTVRFGYDAIFNILENNKGTIEKFFKDFIINPKKKFSSSARITIPPFPIKDKEQMKERATDVHIAHDLKDLCESGFWAEDIYCDDEGELRTAGTDGIIGVQIALGNSIESSSDAVLKAAKNLHIAASKQYRIDIKDRPLKVMEQMEKQGIEL